MNKKICCSFVLCFVVFAGCVTTSQISDDEALKMRITTAEKHITVLRQQQDKMRKALFNQARQQQNMNKRLSEYKTQRIVVPKIARFTDPSNEDVQTALKKAGYYTGAIDGKVGPMTRDALMKFQEENDVKVDGVVGRGTWQLLREYL